MFVIDHRRDLCEGVLINREIQNRLIGYLFRLQYNVHELLLTMYRLWRSLRHSHLSQVTKRLA